MEYQPTSGLGWIDFSAEDRGKVMKVIELLQAEGTVDELGIGVIRNSLSDAMFNGITTIQSRAKYFFIIPRIIQSYILKSNKSISALKYLYDEETRIMNQLTWALDDPNKQGIIGYTVAQENDGKPERRWQQVERKPSTIYWNGLRAFGFLKTNLSLANLLQEIEKVETNVGILDYLNNTEEKGDDIETSWNDTMYFNLPFDPKWDLDLKIDLTEEEANILRNKIIDTQKNQLLAQILKEDERIRQFLDVDNFGDMSKLPFIKTLDVKTQAIIKTAIQFWEIFYGAHVRYNILLQERHGSFELKEVFEKKWTEWMEDMAKFDWAEFNQELMWLITDEHSNVKPRTRKFINDWIDSLKTNSSIDVLNNLVENQEKNNKGKRAKLLSTNDEKYSRWIGIENMQFRFNNAKTIVNDIAKGLNITRDKLQEE